MAQNNQTDSNQNFQKQLEGYADITTEGMYAVEQRYDRSALAIAGGGFALFAAALLQLDAKARNIDILENFSEMIYVTALAFIISIIFILAHQVFGSRAHREMLRKARKAIKLTSQGETINHLDLGGGISEKISKVCFILSAIAMFSGLVAAIVTITFWFSTM